MENALTSNEEKAAQEYYSSYSQAQYAATVAQAFSQKDEVLDRHAFFS